MYIDVDEIFVRRHGARRISMPAVIWNIKKLKEEGAVIYCLISVSVEYAKESAIEFEV